MKEPIPLYKYEREGGGVTVSPIKPDTEYTVMYRLIADEGKVLTQDEGLTRFCSIDTETTDGWIEIIDPEEEISSEEFYELITDIL